MFLTLTKKETRHTLKMKTIMKHLILIFFINLLFFTTYAQRPQNLPITNFTDFGNNAEQNYSYNFGDPVYADILTADPTSYVPKITNRYNISVYGPRHKKEEMTSNITYFDFHKGTDITPRVEHDNFVYNDTDSPIIHCMCEGVVSKVVDGDDIVIEATGEGRYVEVKCDKSFSNAAWGNVYIASRHLRWIKSGLKVNDQVHIGDTLGQMGSSGVTENVHLHLSAIRKTPNDSYNVHPMRIFNPDAHDHLLDQLTYAEITQLDYDANSALFRIAIPYNMANLRHIKVTLGSSYQKVYDFEEIAKEDSQQADDNDFVNGLELFAYPFNRGRDAYHRFWSKYEDLELDATYPASQDRGVGNYYPFLSENLLNTPAYVVDLKVKDLPANYDISQLKIELLDIYGHGVYVNGQADPNGGFAYSRINATENDAEQNGSTIDLDDTDDLDLKAGRYVGLRFTDLNLPKDAQINRAIVQFRSQDPQSGSLNVEVMAEKKEQALAFTTVSSNISNREANATTARFSWTPPNWVADTMNIEQQTVELGLGLEEVVQELVELPNWDEDSPMVLIFKGISGSGRRDAHSFDSSDRTKRHPYLYIEYTKIPNDPPTISLYKPTENTVYDFNQTLYLQAFASDVDGTIDNVEFFIDGDFVGDGTNSWGTMYWNAWIPNTIGTHTVYAVATDNQGQTTTTPTVTFEVLQKQTFQQKIYKGSNDVEEGFFGQMILNDGDLELTRNYMWPFGYFYQKVGLRYENVSIPKNAIITNAYVQFTSDETGTSTGGLYIYAHDVNNAPAFSSQSLNLSNRTLTSEYKYWHPGQWTTIGTAGYAQKTGNMKNVIQEIVDRPGWNKWNDLALIIQGNGRRTAESWEGMSSGAPKLVIEYFAPSNSNSNMLSNKGSENDENENLEMRTLENSILEIETEAIIDFEVKITPNPVTGRFFRAEIDTPFSEELAKVTFHDINGKVLSHQTIMLSEQTEVIFDANNYSAGTYFVNVKIGKQQKTEKVLLVWH